MSISLINQFSEIISRLEYGTERIAYLEKKLKMLNDDRQEELNAFIEIMGKSKECFKEIFQENRPISGIMTDTSGTKPDYAETENETR